MVWSRVQDLFVPEAIKSCDQSATNEVLPYLMTKGLAGTVFAVEIQTLFVSRYSCIASMPFSRPSPECFIPPNGIKKVGGIVFWFVSFAVGCDVGTDPLGSAIQLFSST